MQKVIIGGKQISELRIIRLAGAGAFGPDERFLVLACLHQHLGPLEQSFDIVRLRPQDRIKRHFPEILQIRVDGTQTAPS